jgi:type II secretory pathway pseudopilin PulG
MMRKNVLRRATGGPDHGFTLVEMVVTSLLAALVFGVVGSIAVITQKVSRVNIQRNDDTAQARIMADEVTKLLRMADGPHSLASAIATARPNEVLFYARVNTAINGDVEAPRKVRVWLDTSTTPAIIKQEITNPDTGSAPAYTYTGSPSRPRVLARNVVNDGSRPLFAYQDVSGVTLTSPVSSSQLQRIAAVTLNVQVRGPAGQGAAPAVIDNIVQLLNYKP